MLYIMGGLLSTIGATLLFAVIFLLKKYGFNLQNFLLVSPLILLNQYIFNYIYSSVYPNLNKGWIITTLVVTTVIFILSVFVYKESINIKTVIAFILIFIAAYLLKN